MVEGSPKVFGKVVGDVLDLLVPESNSRFPHRAAIGAAPLVENILTDVVTPC